MKNINLNINNKKEEIETNKSDLSITTNLKVFNGYIGNDNLVKELNKKVSTIKNISQNSSTQKKVSFLSNLSNEENFHRKDSDAFSFGNGNDLGHSSNHSNSNVNSNNNSNDLIPNIKSDINSTLNMINNNNNINSNRSKNSSLSKKSSGRSMSFNDPNDIEFNNNNINNNDNNNNIISIVPKGLFMTTEGFLAEEMNKNLNDENGEEKNEKNINNNNKNLIGDVFYKGFNNIVDCFTVATIEKGVALLVSNEDCIFTLPTFLLPKGIKAGNMYKFAIDQNENNDEIEKEIFNIQKKYKKINLRKNNNNDNNDNVKNNNNNSINNFIMNNIRNNNNKNFNNNNNDNKKQKK